MTHSPLHTIRPCGISTGSHTIALPRHPRHRCHHVHLLCACAPQYLFNGDLVDRGDRGLEIFLLTAAYRVLDPDSVIIHRGNHEDAAMNKTSVRRRGKRATWEP